MTEPESPWNDEEIAPLERDDLFVAQAKRFADAVLNHCPVDCPLSEALQTLRVNLAILKGVDSRTWQTIDTGSPLHD